MAGSMEQQQDLMAGYVLGDLSPEEADALAQMVTADPAVRADIQSLQLALEMAYNPPPVPVPSHLRETVLKAASVVAMPSAAETRDLSGIPHAGSGPAPTGVEIANLRLWQWLGGLGLVASLALGFNNVRLWQALQTAQISNGTEDPSDQALRYTLDPTDINPNAAATAEVVVDVATLQANLTVRDLPVLAPGEVYALWTVVDETAPLTTDGLNAILTGVFEVDETGRATLSIQLPPFYQAFELVRAIAITREQADAPQRHQGSPLLITFTS
ncbi:MAG: hypothetical protein HC924_04655 [Synechococcaceae cyanobacterium SM2_3_2]|nr:hypothetical protein [Synechococcaceae cyanobacterium SM2_3_2]